MNVRAWLASAVWACLCGIASELFLVVSLLGLLILFFGALISAILAPLLLLLPSDWQWTGWQWVAIGLVVWLAVVALLGVVAGWSFIRCRAVVFVAPVSGWTRATSVLGGVIASFALWVIVPGFEPPLPPQGMPLPAEPPGAPPVTV
jgi:hypothetical protein